MIKAVIRGEAVTLGKNRKWRGASPALLEKLEAITEGVVCSGADPNPPMTIASAAIQALGGKITKAAKSEGVPGRIYAAPPLEREATGDSRA